MADVRERMENQQAQDRELVAKQTGQAGPAGQGNPADQAGRTGATNEAPDVSTRIQDSGAAAPRVAEETARAADKHVRSELVEDMKDALTGRGGQG